MIRHCKVFAAVIIRHPCAECIRASVPPRGRSVNRPVPIRVHNRGRWPGAWANRHPHYRSHSNQTTSQHLSKFYFHDKTSQHSASKKSFIRIAHSYNLQWEGRTNHFPFLSFPISSTSSIINAAFKVPDSPTYKRTSHIHDTPASPHSSPGISPACVRHIPKCRYSVLWEKSRNLSDHSSICRMHTCENCSLPETAASSCPHQINQRIRHPFSILYPQYTLPAMISGKRPVNLRNFPLFCGCIRFCDK